MKKIILMILLCCNMCAKKEEVKVENSYSYVELDRARMEQVVILLPVVLQKAMEFQSIAKNIIDATEYNTKFYEYLFKEEAFSDRLLKAGFENTKTYEEFYSEMIEMFLLLSEKPESFESATHEIPILEKEIKSLLLRQAQEPNNEKLTATLNRYQYELATYKNIVLVNEFLPQLNAFN